MLTQRMIVNRHRSNPQSNVTELKRKLIVDYEDSLGSDELINLAAGSWPCWDSTMGLIIFVDDKPVSISSCVLNVFKARHRRDVGRVPDLKSTNWEYYAINEDTLPAVGTSGNVTIVFLGERERPCPLIPLEPEDLDVLFSGTDGRDFFLASVDAFRTSAFQAVTIRHDGYVLEQFPRLPKSLGFAADSTEWIPQDWYEPLALGSMEFGTSTIAASREGFQASTVEWLRQPFTTFNFYWVRLVPPVALDLEDQSHATIEADPA